MQVCAGKRPAKRLYFSIVQRKALTPNDFASLTTELLRFAAERTAVRSCVERLAAVPAEARLRRFARFQPRVDLLHFVEAGGGSFRRRRRARRAA